MITLNYITYLNKSRAEGDAATLQLSLYALDPNELRLHLAEREWNFVD
jgi:hypothetical protein